MPRAPKIQPPLELTRKDLDPNPFRQFDHWFQEAVASVPLLPEAMALATVSREGRPSIRTVLLKYLDQEGFVFYTNYESQKAKELDHNPNAASVFHWRELHRQICIKGTVSKTSQEKSETYFQKRPRGSQLSALASEQSQPLSCRKELERRFKSLERKHKGKMIALPSNWGGYRLNPSKIEFWQGRPDRLHDRFVYVRQDDGLWLIKRLNP